MGKLFELGTRDLHTVAIGQGSTVAAKAPEAPQGAVARFNENKLLGLGVSAAAAVAAVAAAERTAAADKSDEAAALAGALPRGHGHICFDADDLPVVFKRILQHARVIDDDLDQ